MRVSLAVNAHLSNAVALGPGKVGYTLAKELFDQSNLGKIFCYSADSTVDIAKNLLIETEPKQLIRYAFGLSHRIGKKFPSLPIRRLEERYFDQIAGRQLRQEMGNLLFCTKPVNPDLIEKAKSFGWLTVMSTSILHPRFNLEMVAKEQARLHLTNSSVYTDENRVRHLERALAGVDRIVAANDFFIDNYEQYGVPRNKFALAEPMRPHEGVDTTRFYPPLSGLERSEKFRVLHVSHMTLIKGVQYLLDAWKKIEREIDGELVLAGPTDAQVHELIRRCKATKIRVTGPLHPLEEYREASIFISPSVSDAGPNTVFEAMACGTPAIVSQNCGISRFIKHGINGFTYQYNDVDHLAELILHCYKNPEMRLTLAEQALTTARNYQLTDYTTELITLLHKVSADHLRRQTRRHQSSQQC